MHGRRRHQRLAGDGDAGHHRLHIAQPDRRQLHRPANLARHAQHRERIGESLFLDQQERFARHMRVHRPFGPAQPPAQIAQAIARLAVLHRRAELDQFAPHQTQVAPLRQPLLVRRQQCHVRSQQCHVQRIAPVHHRHAARWQSMIRHAHHRPRRAPADRYRLARSAHRKQRRAAPPRPATGRRDHQRRIGHALGQSRQVGQHQARDAMGRIHLPHDRAGRSAAWHHPSSPRHPPQRQPHRHRLPFPLLNPP